MISLIIGSVIVLFCTVIIYSNKTPIYQRAISAIVGIAVLIFIFPLIIKFAVWSAILLIAVIIAFLCYKTFA